jgi:3-methyladenine DNA glycosylase AlkD
MQWTPDQAALRAAVESQLDAVADAEAAPAMQAYMKTEMPFRGVRSPARKPVVRALRDAHRPKSQGAYAGLIRAVWDMPHREDKYVALGLARAWKKFVGLESLPLYEAMVREGAWWDFVDEIATHLIGRLVVTQRETMLPVLDRFVADEDMWIRRVGLLAQMPCKAQTDSERLARYCRLLAPESEFFIRKAIGWSLREYAKTDPEWVRAFLSEHGEELSGLSRREASKHL